MSVRERWLLSHVSGEVTVDIGFAGQKNTLPPYFPLLKGVKPRGRIIGVDYNREAVLDRKQDDSLVGDASCLPLKTESVDCIILAEFLEHHACIGPFLLECRRVLRTGGQLLITTPNPYFVNRMIKNWFFISLKGGADPSDIRESMGHDDHIVLWDPLSLCNQLLHAGFTVNEVTSLGIWIPWLNRLIPAFHQGIYLKIWPFNRIGHITCLCCDK